MSRMGEGLLAAAVMDDADGATKSGLRPGPRRRTLLSRSLSPLALLTVVMILVTYNVTTKHALKHKSDPLLFSLLRDACSWPILHLAAVTLEKPVVPPLRAHPRLIILGLVGVCLNQYFYILSLDWCNATLAALITQIQPAIAFIATISLGIDRFSLTRAAGVVVTIIGALSALGVWSFQHIHNDNDSSGSRPLLGLVFGILSAACGTGWYIAMKPVIYHWGFTPLNCTAWCYLYATLGTVILSLTVQVDWGGWTWTKEQCVGLAVAVMLNSCAKYFLLVWLNQRPDVSITTIALVPSALFPPLSAIADTFMLGSPLPMRFLYGGFFVVLGVVMVQLGGKPEASGWPLSQLWGCQRAALRFTCDVRTDAQLSMIRGRVK